MKILHIMNELRPSGAEVMLELAAPEWQSMGCELYLLALADTPGPHATRLEEVGWNVSHISKEGGIFQLIRQITSAVEYLMPDIVHLHQEGKSLPLCYAVKRAGVPMCRTVHNNFPFSGRLRLQKTVERSICRFLGSHHIAISSSVQANERNRFKNTTELCWNWFNAEAFRSPTPEEKQQSRERLGIPSGRKILVSVGNGSDIKNYRAIIEALAHIDDDLLHYYQVGNSHPDGIDGRLATELAVHNRVHFIGPRKDILDWLWASDLYLMPSIFEGLSIAAIEAISAGCRCIFADRPGLADFKEFGIHAQWIRPESQHIHQAISQSLNQTLDQELLQKNSDTVRQSFGVANRSRAYFDIWNSLSSATSP